MNTPTKYDVVLELQAEDACMVYMPDLPGCISEGRTINEDLSMIADAIAGHLAVRSERGWSQLIKILQQNGWEHARTTNSHYIMANNKTRSILSVPQLQSS